MELVGNTFFFDWEVSLIIWLQAHMGSFGTSLASFLSAFGEELPVGTMSAELEGLNLPVPKGSEVLLQCTLAGAYNYPFKKVRIFNCNLEQALGL